MRKTAAIMQSLLVVVLVIGFHGCAYFEQTSSDVGSSETYDPNRGLGEEGYFYSGEGEDMEEAAPVRRKRVKSSSVKGGYETTSIAYPTGSASTSVLKLEKTYPRVVVLGEPYKYTLKVTNLTNLSLKDVSVSEVIPADFQLDEAMPNYSDKIGQDVSWELGTLNPKEVRTIQLSGKADSKEDLPCCTSADYDVPSLCVTTSVVQPAIAVDIEVPSSAILCDRIPLVITVENTGDSLLKDVQVTSDLPDGTMSSGKDMISIRAGSLNAGEVKEYTAYVEPQETGVFSFKASAQANGVSDESDSEITIVSQPELAISAESSKDEIYVGRPVEFTINVKNSSSEIAENTVIEAIISGSARLKDISDNGSTFGRGVSWNLGNLAGNTSKELSFTVTGTDAGSIMTEAKARAVCTEPVMADASSSVKGIPALLLEVVDIDDPIEVGAIETYVISVTNQGSANATNVEIEATLDGMSYVSSTGSTSGSASGNTVNFGAVSSLGPRQVAEWRLKVTGTRAGDLRFKVKMDSDQLTSSVQETESTYVY